MNTDGTNADLGLPTAPAPQEEKSEPPQAVAELNLEVAEQTEPGDQLINPAPATSAGWRGKSKRGPAPQWGPRMSDAAWERRRMERLLDKPCAESPRLMQDRNGGRDCLSQMSLYRSRPDVLANALRAMGITDNGDEMPDQERTE